MTKNSPSRTGPDVQSQGELGVLGVELFSEEMHLQGDALLWQHLAASSTIMEPPVNKQSGLSLPVWRDGRTRRGS